MSTVKTTFEFGPGGALVGLITAPEREKATLGAVLWGMGIAELKIARRLVKEGIVVIQIRINDGNQFKDFDKRNAIYDSSGVSYCRLAMDLLEREKALTQFILMGNCACANVSFNAAVADERVVGLIMTNPTFMDLQTLGVPIVDKLLSSKMWKRLLSGEMDVRPVMQLLKKVIAGKLTGKANNSVATSLRAASKFQGDLPLPADFDNKLQRLVSRGVETLLVYARTEESLQYLQKTYHRKLTELKSSGKFRLDIIDGDAHVFSTDDIAAEALNQTISGWIGKALPGAA